MKGTEQGQEPEAEWSVQSAKAYRASFILTIKRKVCFLYPVLLQLENHYFLLTTHYRIPNQLNKARGG